MWVVLVAGVIAALGVAGFVLSQRPKDSKNKKKKSRKHSVEPVEPVKDWEKIAERLQRKCDAVERRLREEEAAMRSKGKELETVEANIRDLERRWEQEQAWRKKEESVSAKEKQKEKILETELTEARDSVDKESRMRIRLEHEVKQLRAERVSLSNDLRRATTENIDLDRKHKDLIEQVRSLKVENAKLKRKKRAQQWVAKPEHIRVEKLLKRARWEGDLFRKKIPQDQWPIELLSEQRRRDKSSGRPAKKTEKVESVQEQNDKNSDKADVALGTDPMDRSQKKLTQTTEESATQKNVLSEERS